MEVDLAVIADAATIDAAGKLNILGIFDRLSAASFPTRHPRLSLVLRFTAGLDQAGAHTIDIVLKGPDGNEVVRLDGEMRLGVGPQGAALVPHVLNMDGLVFPAAGRYSFDVGVDGEHKVSLPLLVEGPAAPVAQA